MISLRKKESAVLFTSNGFTLVELMIGLVITSVIIAAIYAAYTTQQRLYGSQEQIAEMQQNIRAAVDLMARDIRMVGYDPTGDSGAGLLPSALDDKNLALGQMSFTLDTNEDGKITDGTTYDTGEKIDFGFSATIDADRDGIPNSETSGIPNAANLGVQTGGAGGYQAIAENIQAVEFLYFDEDGDQTLVPASARSVKISILARAGDQDRKFKHTSTYTTPSGATWGPYNDRYRRRFVMVNIQFRNVGI